MRAREREPRREWVRRGPRWQWRQEPAMTDPTRVFYPDLRRTYRNARWASGSYVYDDDGRAYLDGCSGAIVVNLGHGNPEILDAMRAQLDQITFSYRTQFSNEPAERLARQLAALAPGDLDYVQFTNSGSEAIEAAMRLAVQFWRERGRPGKYVVISRQVSYHGSTLGSLALTGHEPRRQAMAPLLPALPRIPAAYCHRCPFGLTPQSCALECASALEAMIEEIGSENVAAFVAEPVVGAAGGAIPSPPGYLASIAEICQRHDVLLIADEVMTGLGRTGYWFGCDEAGVVPDLLVVGKGMSAGYVPIGGVLVSSRIQRAIRDGSGGSALGHTYSGNPLATATASAVVDYLVRHDIPARAGRMGAVLHKLLSEAVAERGVAADVRGRGLLLGVDFAPPHAHTQARNGPGPAAAEAAANIVDSGITAEQVVSAAFAAGLLVYPAGADPQPRAVLVAPPLTISTGDLHRLAELFAGVLDTLLAGATRIPEGSLR